MPPPEPTRCGVVAIVGAPNAGKSTLLNALLGQKLAITSPKVQTTRTRLLGIVLEGPAQILFLDTPGLFTPRRLMDRAMVSDAWDAARDADVTLFLLDSKTGLDPSAVNLLDRLPSVARTPWLALNKVDLVDKPRLLELAAAANARVPFQRTFMIAALTGDGVGDLRHALAQAMPEGPWLYPPDQVTNAPARLLAAELTREQLFRQLGQELPYASAVLPETFEERPDGSAVVRQQILVERDSQKAIVLGRGGARIRAIGKAARAEIARALDRPIHLFLHVSVRPGWRDDPRVLRELGLPARGR
ncbi:MAG: GTPase Era [Sphingomonadaceae bacterium]|uniref:GTPase Era n=1 Tax=Thermaurantiacus sp. TaxID=2820283 RepID=UPI00298F1C39|nr:GTPase Era [Thermaurantiacus sp.]MCS6987705.1 GTPase Era [Sphingomonadaceae bacterium]MDW8415076.1 GTPase Era [Thermaurantiacus sp.]